MLDRPAREDAAESAQPDRPRAPGVAAETPLQAVLALQRSAGNHAVAGLLQRALIGGVDRKDDAHGINRQILDSALEAIIFLQEDKLGQPDSWLDDLLAINTELQTNGMSPVAEAAIRQLYSDAAELSFVCNPILNEAWQRCLNATKAKNNYSAVGGKFKDKLPEVLHEIATDFPTLEPKCKLVRVPKINKEHMVNKGAKFGGPQTDPFNLMYAGVPPSGGTATLSEFHKGLHAMKPGTGNVNYNALHPTIQTIIETAQKTYKPDAMGTFV